MSKPKYLFSERLTVVLEFLALVCMAVMTILIVAQVVLRYLFNEPLTWSEELARIVFIYMTFIGIGAAYGRRRHMSVDAIVILLPMKIQKAIRAVVVGIASVFLLVVMFVTVRSMVELFRIEINTPALDIPMGLVYMIIPLGFSALIAQMWIHLLQEKKEREGG
jgi:TRAP-type C4-dicarboxylate transport system permease small subunit